MWIFPIIKCTNIACNLRCKYCFYRYLNQAIKPFDIISEEVLSRLMSELLAINKRNCTFLWHGGEPLLAGHDFFKKVISLQKKIMSDYPNITINNSIQTNGTLIDRKFAQIFKESNFRVGVSLDGPMHIHDYYRHDVYGNGSFKATLNGIRTCQEIGLSVSVVSVVTSYSSKFADEIYRFFLSEGIKRFTFNPAFEIDESGKLCNFSVNDNDFGNFMERILELWLEEDNPDIDIRQFTEPLMIMLGGNSSVCVFSGECFRFLDFFPDGTVRPCHNPISKSSSLGNVLDQNLKEIVLGDKYKSFKRQSNELSKECSSCKWFSMCHGGCTDQRNLRADGIEYKKYVYCGSRRRIFKLLEDSLSAYENQLGVSMQQVSTCV